MICSSDQLYSETGNKINPNFLLQSPLLLFRPIFLAPFPVDLSFLPFCRIFLCLKAFLGPLRVFGVQETPKFVVKWKSEEQNLFLFQCFAHGGFCWSFLIPRLFLELWIKLGCSLGDKGGVLDSIIQAGYFSLNSI